MIGLLVVVFLFVADPLFNLGFGLLTDRRSAVSDVVAVAERSLARLNTIEAIYKVVFPYDFLPNDVDFERLETDLTSGRALSADEVGYAEVFSICSEAGIDFKPKRSEFVVITAIAKIGFDLDSFSRGSRNVVNGKVGPVSVRSDETLVVALPEAIITELIIDDAASDTYAYPDIGLSPEEWKRVSSFVSKRIQVQISQTAVMQEAEDAGRRFLEYFFRESGYKSHIF